jgi:hypothetical protein
LPAKPGKHKEYIGVLFLPRQSLQYKQYFHNLFHMHTCLLRATENTGEGGHEDRSQRSDEDVDESNDEIDSEGGAEDGEDITSHKRQEPYHHGLDSTCSKTNFADYSFGHPTSQ